MATLRELPIPKLTYRELANRLLETILTAEKNAKRIDVVFDIYTQKIQLKIQKETGDPKKVCNYSKLFLQVSSNNGGGFLSSNDNKKKFISFLVEEWKQLHNKIESEMFYASSSKEAFRITSEGARRKETLDGDHQEADTRIFIHALHAIQQMIKL